MVQTSVTGCMSRITRERSPWLDTVQGYKEEWSNFIEPEKPVQLRRVGRPVRKEPNPHGSVDQDHQAALRFARGLSRRLGTSRA